MTTKGSEATRIEALVGICTAADVGSHLVVDSVVAMVGNFRVMAAAGARLGQRPVGGM